MNRYLFSVTLALASVAVIASTPAHADDITIDTTPFVSVATRAEVRAELYAYKKAGINPWSRQYNPLRFFKSTTSRAEVTTEYIANRTAVAAMNGEDSGSRYLTQERQKAHLELEQVQK